MPSGPVAVIDIGSNSIKVLVAVRGEDGHLLTLRSHTLEARISAGISGNPPQLAPEGMARGVEAIRTLLTDAEAYGAASFVLVATSAVRDARNGDAFRALVRDATGHEIRILTGEEEAALIGRGLSCDPALPHPDDFTVFDLGGGSLECLVVRARRVEQAVSLPLGCVRLTEKFVAAPDAPFPPAAFLALAAHVREEFSRAAFTFPPVTDGVAVGTGGTIATARAVQGRRDGLAFDATPPLVTVAQLRDLLAILGGMPLAPRRLVPGLPASRADVFPAALATLLTVAELGGFTSFHHSLYNLRYGLADQALPR